jgi:hypothetical protein
VLHPLLTHHSAESAELLYPIGLASFAVAAHGSRRAAIAGLVAFVPVITFHSFEDPGVRGADPTGQWAAAFLFAVHATLPLAP